MWLRKLLDTDPLFVWLWVVGYLLVVLALWTYSNIFEGLTIVQKEIFGYEIF